MTFYKNRTQSLNEKVYLKLYNAILVGDYRPGNSLLVVDIAKELGTSQAPVREALERLKQEDMVKKEPNKSAIVTDVSINEIEEIYQLRELIEGFAVKETMKKIKSDDINILYDIYEEMKIVTETDDIYRFNKLDMKFHGFFYERCENKAILEIWKKINIKIIRFIVHTNKIYYKNLNNIAESHLPLIKIIESGDQKKAENIYLEHMQEVWWRINNREDIIINNLE